MAKLPAELGEVLGGYRLESVLGKGGMGCVYLGTHALLGRKAAVKVLGSTLATDDQFVSRFFHEAKIVNDIRHPNIVDIVDFVSTENPKRVAYVMEYIEGPPLNALLKDKRFTVFQSVNIAIQLAKTLAAVHRLNVVHRDLKPANILINGDINGDLTTERSVKILDFGIAKIEDSDAAHKTNTGAMLGTPAYMAPEQAAADKVSPATDIYALGEILYELITGVRAFSGDNMTMLRAKVQAVPPNLPMPPDTPCGDELLALVTKCLQPPPQERPKIEEFLTTLHNIRTRLPRDVIAGSEIPAAMTPVDPHEEDLSQPSQPSHPSQPSRPGLPSIAPPAWVMDDAGGLASDSGWPAQAGPASVTSSPLNSVAIEPPQRFGMALKVGGGLFALAAVVIGAAVFRGSGQPEHSAVPMPQEATAAVEPATPRPKPTAPVDPPPKPESVKIRLETTPAGAEVLDASGKKLGVSPLEVEVGANPIPVRIKMAGYVEKSLELGSEEPLQKVALSPEPPRDPGESKPKPSVTQVQRPAVVPVVAPPPAKAKTKTSGPLKKRELPTW